MRRSLWLLAAAALVAGVGLGLRSLVVYAGTLGAVLVAARGMARRSVRGLSIERDVRPWGSEGERTVVRLDVVNRGPGTARCILLSDDFTPDRHGEKRIPVAEDLLPGASTTTTYAAEYTKRRGVYAVGPLRVACSDPMGLYLEERNLGGGVPLTVFPASVPVGAMPLAVRPRWDAAGLSTARNAGQSLHFFSTREYREGDPLRFIHWPSTARTGRLVVREFELDTTAEVNLFLDLHYYTLKGFARETTLEYAVRAAASIARTAIARGCRVQLRALGKREVRVPRGGGPLHLTTILGELVHMQADGNLLIEDLLLDSVPLCNPGSTAVAIFTTSRIDPRKLLDVVLRLRGRGAGMIAVLIDDNTFLSRWEGIADKTVHASTIPDLVALLRTHGVTVYKLARGEDLGGSLARPELPTARSFRGVPA